MRPRTIAVRGGGGGGGRGRVAGAGCDDCDDVAVVVIVGKVFADKKGEEGAELRAVTSEGLLLLRCCCCCSAAVGLRGDDL